MKSTVAVIGSNSFSGSHCVDYFLDNTDYRIIGISRSQEKKEVFLPYRYKKEKPLLSRFNFYQYDLNKHLDRIIKLFDKEKPNFVINFAAQGIVDASWQKPEDWFRTNCLSLVNLTHRLKDKRYLKKYIQISTPEVYGSYSGPENLNYYNPSTPYAASKAAADLSLITLYKKFGFPVSFVRSVNVYGPHQQLFRVIPRAIIYIKNGRKIPLHHGGLASRSFIHITDVVKGIHNAILRGKVGVVYHFSSGENITIKDLIGLICRNLRVPFHRHVTLSKKRAGQDAAYDLHFSATARQLRWKPKVSLEEGIGGVIKWIEDSWDEIISYPLEYIHKN